MLLRHHIGYSNGNKGSSKHVKIKMNTNQLPHDVRMNYCDKLIPDIELGHVAQNAKQRRVTIIYWS